MIVIDSSAWVEFLRGTDSPTSNAVDQLLGSEIAVTDVITMEILAGAGDESHLRQLRRLLAVPVLIPTTPADHDHAAAIYRICRRSGHTVRKLVDCLIAAVTIEAGASLLHADADFTTIARHTALQIHPDSPI